MSLTKVSSESVERQEMLGDENINQKRSYIFMKRLIDIVGSFCGIIILLPVFIIVAICIKLEDPKGPVFFKQIRVGKDEKDFGMYKFRSMVTDAEEKLQDLLQHNEVSGAMFKMKDDPRVTKIGKFIRKTSIDELPQLINVLKGEMSLVGPRPPLLREVKTYTAYDKQRLKVIPGCTGLWQVSGRSNIGFREMVELDLYYIQYRSILFDFKIILKTVFVLFGSKDAF
ncbi:exopolysaccharide biosynthesis polyprenyl glycosylphosphotransferase family protein [Bacillus cereus 03BB102]|uniref:Multidrug MFS transporter n=2 Tax=Bacillus cereus group TaxID=86661 RepID=A0A0J1KK90_BACAN|nr:MULTISPECIES: sugar transferase [Bacillus]MRB21927.1 exopolysaccharide biosynthesis polyprenyl glycosylphosphotransferase [Bacillus thuringiensis]ACO31197.1 galactosyl transferase CpsE [Bacillus cereus 03BB102]AEW58381.1 Undecaprenyl-phosphate galactosephosphotransferase [Bacillus cereus F837/76]AJG52703.1 exopolysaccharide biosynthesis polyprenyl glycosylphosphotransferase family protein [Bacillus cereus 03BB102]KLV17055.1 multidrug MFS transporter [Bacillus anthracis]